MKFQNAVLNKHTLLAILAVAALIAPTYAGTLQINTPDTPPQWDESLATQTGYIGAVPISITTSRETEPWNSTFIDEYAGYSSSLVGSLAHPPGTVGDFLNQHVYNGDQFWTTFTLGGPLKDPIFYISDIDTVGASVTFPAGFTTIEVSADGQQNGNSMTAISGFAQDTPGAWLALQYEGLFDGGTEFAFYFDFDVVSETSAENIGLGMAVFDEIPDTPVGVPEPSTLILLTIGSLGLAFIRKK